MAEQMRQAVEGTNERLCGKRAPLHFRDSSPRRREKKKFAVCNQSKQLENLAPRARFELATLRLTAKGNKNLNALSGVAYRQFGAIFPFLVAPNPAPKLSKATMPPT